MRARRIRSGAHDRGARTPEPAGPVDEVRLDDIGIGAHVRSPDRVAQRREQTGRDAHRRRCYGCGRARPRAKIGVVSDQPSHRGRLLVAAPPLVDPNFDRTVVLMLEHGDDAHSGSS
jgi:hypothetical protein